MGRRGNKRNQWANISGGNANGGGSSSVKAEESKPATWGPADYGFTVPNSHLMTRKEYYKEQQRLHDEMIAREAFQEKMMGWPWKETPGRLLTAAPYVENALCEAPNSMSGGMVKQSAPIFSLLAKNDIRVIIMGYANTHADMSALAATCRQAFQMVSKDMNLWNMTTGDFDIQEDQQKVGRNVLVVPTRVQERMAYGDQLVHAQKMTFEMARFTDNFSNLYLHHVPFVNTKLLSIVIPHMPNLKMLGIYNCELIHFGDTKKLLEIVRTDKMKGKQVALDFFPRYHQGPASGNPQPYSGSYGVTWDNAEIDTRLAIWKIVYDLTPQAREQGVDLESPSSAFRRWLDRSPCWRVEDTLLAVNAYLGKLEDLGDICNFIVWVDYPTYKGDVPYFVSNIPNRHEGWEWMTEKYDCLDCKKSLLGIFYDYPQIRQFRLDGIPMLVCLGCKLLGTLDREADHYKSQKQKILNVKWLKNSRGDTEPLLSQIVTEARLSRGYRYAGLLDDLRGQDLAQGRDEEDQPAQRPLPQSLGKHYWYHQSPQVDSQDGRVLRRNYIPNYQLYANGHY
ncbi:hypothetical protein PVAG01_06271 [Phlyctema vagabunda]|uniref:Uncharacterized protein n=1 Tax=Phlyctema vagabunda TaxID=108571 RepID=A0ABR4PFL3_9HELO